MAAGVAALATHYYAAVAVVSVAIAFALARRRVEFRVSSFEGRVLRPNSKLETRNSKLVWLALAGAVVLGGLVWFASASGFRTSLTAVYLRPVPHERILESIVEALGAPLAGPLSTEASLAAALLILLPIGWLGLRGFPAGAGPVFRVSLWGFCAAGLGVPLLLLLGRAFAPRFGMLAVPFLAVLFGLAATRISPWALSISGGIYGMAALLAIAPFYGDYTRADYGVAMDALRARARPDDAIILNGPWQELLYRRYGWGLPERYIIASTVPLEAAEAVGWLERLTTTHRRLWIVDSATDAGDPNGVVVRWLDAHAYPAPVVEFRKALLRPYLTDQAWLPALEARPMTPQARSLGLTSLMMDRWTVAPGGESRLRVELAGRSQSSEIPAGGEGAKTERRVSVQLVGPDERAVWHWDGPVLPAGDRGEYRAALTVPDGARPGDYVLRAMVYEREATSQRVTWATDRVEIAELRMKNEE